MMMRIHSLTDHDAVPLVRSFAGVIAAVVVIDAVWVQAGFLAILAVPFIAIALLMRSGGTPATAAAMLANLFYALIGLNFIAVNRFSAPGGDLLFAYVGTPLALASLFLLGRHAIHEHHAHTATP